MRICPLCNKESDAASTGVFGKYTMYLCGACGVEFCEPFRGPGPLWYENSEMYSVGRVITKRPEWYHREALRGIERRGSLIDIGCGTGIFLHEAKRLGFDVWGIDFDKKNIELAKSRYGLDKVYCLSVADLKKRFGANKFDVVTFFEVLEHLDKPAAFLEDLKGLLRPDGVIVLSVPNKNRFIDTLGAGDSPPNHLTRWSADALRGFLDYCGFEVLRLHEKRLNADDVSSYLKSKIRLGLAHGLVKKGLAENDQGSVQKAGYLIAIKDTVFGIISCPPGLLFSLFGLKGGGMVAIARQKG